MRLRRFRSLASTGGRSSRQAATLVVARPISKIAVVKVLLRIQGMTAVYENIIISRVRVRVKLVICVYVEHIQLGRSLGVQNESCDRVE